MATVEPRRSAPRERSVQAARPAGALRDSSRGVATGFDWLPRAWLALLEPLLHGPRFDPAEQREFDLFASRATGRAGQVLLVLTASLMLLLWPIDLLVLGGSPSHMALLGVWRVIYAAIALGSARWTTQRLATNQGTAGILSGTVLVFAGGTYAVLGRIVPLESPWIHTAVVVPAFTMYVLLPPLPRLALVAATSTVTWSAIVLSANGVRVYTHWIETGGVALLTMSFSFVFGHVCWVGARWFFVMRRARDEAEAEQQRLEALVVQVERAHDLQALARGVAHEFNNLFHVILGAVDLADRDLPPGMPRPESFADVREAVHRGAQVCRQVLAHAGDPLLALEPLDLDELIPGHFQAIARGLPLDIRIEHERHGNPLVVVADPTRLLDALDRLVADALEGVDGPRGVIATKCDRLTLTDDVLDREPELMSLAPGPYAVVELAQHAAAVDPALRTRLLDPLAVSPPVPRRLGLLSAAAAVRAHRGQIVIDDHPQGGCRWRAFLPLITAAQPSRRLVLPSDTGLG